MDAENEKYELLRNINKLHTENKLKIQGADKSKRLSWKFTRIWGKRSLLWFISRRGV